VVHADDPLVDLDPRDNRVQFDQAQGSLAGEQRGVPITAVQNVTNIQGLRAEVASTRAVVAATERDRDQAAAQVLQQKAANARAERCAALSIACH
jgi:multidrug resistance efflux pump